MLVPIWVPNNGDDCLAVLSTEARTDRDKGPGGPRPGTGATLPLRTFDYGGFNRP
jgi:hypothetical protein